MEALDLPYLYKEYNEETSWFVSWLVYAAKSLGYSSDTLNRNTSKSEVRRDNDGVVASGKSQARMHQKHQMFCSRFYNHCKFHFVDICAFLDRKFLNQPHYLGESLTLYRSKTSASDRFEGKSPTPFFKIRLDLEAIAEIVLEAQGLQSAPRSIVPIDTVRQSLFSDFERNEDVSITSICGAASCRTILEILNNDATRPFDQLQDAARAVKQSLNATINDVQQEKASGAGGDRSEFLLQCKELLAEIDRWILNDGGRAPVQSRVVKLQPKNQRPLFHLFKRHPTVSGLAMFNVYVKLHKLAFAKLRKKSRVINAMHFYDALRRTKSVEHQWEDMERFLLLQSSLRRCVEGGRDDLQSIIRRYREHVYQMLVADARFQKPRTKTNQTIEPTSKGIYLNYETRLRVLSNIYSEHGEFDDLVVDAMNYELQDVVLKMKRDLGGEFFNADLLVPSSKATIEPERCLQILTLSSLGSDAAWWTELITFDYLDFGRQCTTMVQKIKEGLTPDLPNWKADQPDVTFLNSLFDRAMTQQICGDGSENVLKKAGREMDSILKSGYRTENF